MCNNDRVRGRNGLIGRHLGGKNHQIKVILKHTVPYMNIIFVFKIIMKSSIVNLIDDIFEHFIGIVSYFLHISILIFPKIYTRILIYPRYFKIFDLNLVKIWVLPSYAAGTWFKLSTKTKILDGDGSST